MTIKSTFLFIFITLLVSQNSFASSVFNWNPQANTAFNKNLVNFDGLGEIPLLDGNWAMQSFEQISDDGDFTELKYNPNKTYYDENLTFYMNIDNSVGINAITVNLFRSGNEFFYRKSYLICSNDQQPEFNLYTIINELDSGFEEVCIWNDPNFNQFQLFYGKCNSELCIDVNYFINRDRFKSADNVKMSEYGLLLFNNLKSALNGANYSFDFENNF